ncbi:hypothetical protein CF651_04305 [Paenibacillus rigui]|uniref:DUF2249 domain-containing protein n=2 Tax=Paenibacillus rigui TaxID=554312 RepID=A0A229UVQ1_9BACL|nr:hypothetical protein CF651_04305 [Paenibacillus rigui]
MKKQEPRIVELDVRPYLRQKLEPFKLIMDTVASLEPEDVFMMHALFKPTPLLGVMKVKGYAHKAEEMEEGYWIVAFARTDQAMDPLNALPLREFSKRDAPEEGLSDGS